MDALDIPLTSLVTASALILLSIIYCSIKNRGMLPGPNGLPYLGLFSYLTDENAHLKLEEYKKKYGDMFSFTYTGRLYINLGSIKAMREVQIQKSDCFVDRFNDSNILVDILNNGIVFANGEAWKNLRKFFIQKFKGYGLNTIRDDLAGPVYDTLNATIENLNVLHKHPINILEFLSQHCAITMRKVIFGEEGATNEDISKMIMSFAGAMEGTLCTNLLLIGPLAKILLNAKPSFRKNFKHSKDMKRVIFDCVKRIESSMKDNEPTCIVESFYKERNDRRRNNDPSYKYFTDEVLVDSLVQFIGDGIATVAGFIAGLLNTLFEHPEEQDKMHSEIMEVIGPNRQPTAEDRPNLPYTNAVLNECIRTSKLLVFFPSLVCTKETTVRGYKIPKDSITLYNFWSAHHDKETFQDPHKFNPSRFLQTSGKPKEESPVLFGMGKRICTGEPYVMLQTFLFLSTIVKNFKIVSSNASKDESIDFLVAGKLELTFVPRKDT